MEAIDICYNKFKSIKTDVISYDMSDMTESDTRIRIIDRFILEVLGWSYEDINTEEYTGDGFLDYKLSVGGLSRVIVEAKKDSRPLGVESKSGGRHYSLKGPVFHTEAAKEGIKQAIDYCGRKNAELAVVTNGNEWIIFRGSRIGDGKDTLDGVAFVFGSLDDVDNNFNLFYSLICKESVQSFSFRPFFQEAEGRPVRSLSYRKPVRPPESRRVLKGSNLGADIERVMISFFQRLSGDEDPDLITDCFVQTGESDAADDKLARIAEDLIDKIKPLGTASGEELTRLVERARLTKRNDFVLIVGTKGSGKSTFVDRFFKDVLPDDLRSECVVIKIDMSKNDGSEYGLNDWLNREVVIRIEELIFENSAPTYEQIQGLFFDEYVRRLRGPLKYMYNRDKEEFKINFGMHVEDMRNGNPHDYISRLIDYIVKVAKKTPCMVFDNADHFNIEFQERTFQYARSIYEKRLCMVIMPITDRTSWQLSREGALRSFENESLYLPTPSPRAVLERRVAYLQDKIAEEKREPGKGYFMGRGITLSLDNIATFAAAVEGIFLRTGSVSNWIGNLANRDVRRCLELAKNIVTSPCIDVEDLFRSYVSGSALGIPSVKVKESIVIGRYDIYTYDDNKYIRNLYNMEVEGISSPLLSVRILTMLKDVHNDDSEDNFVNIDQIVDYMGSMGIESSRVIAMLNVMLESGLCWSYDPTVTTVVNAVKVEITPSGLQHLNWGVHDRDYMMFMSIVTPINDKFAYEDIKMLSLETYEGARYDQIRRFMLYIIEEDTNFCNIPIHPAFESQAKIIPSIGRLVERR